MLCIVLVVIVLLCIDEVMCVSGYRIAAWKANIFPPNHTHQHQWLSLKLFRLQERMRSLVFDFGGRLDAQIIHQGSMAILLITNIIRPNGGRVA